MAIFKCKMCGANLEVAEGATTAACEYCGSMQTLPAANDELVQNLFNRANALRLKCEFDKAEQIYEKIVQENDTEAEAHWGIVLCKYGIEYVEDPKTLKRIPTCHRTSYDAVVTDADYQAAVKHADVAQRLIYEAEAKQIDGIQRSILDIVKNEKPFDVFLCYKQSDENGKRTPDSAIANDIYHQLTQEGLKVFYAAITLEDKLGQAYEPYIFAALNSAKVMLVIGTKPHYFSAVWVKNEWSRFLKLMKTDRSKLLIPCYKDMDAYELPEEFAHLQAQDMSKIGFINDIVRGIKKVTVKDEPKATVIKETVVSGNAGTAPLLKRAFMFLEDGDWSSANEYCEKVLDLDPECAMAYWGKMMAELKVKKESDLKNQARPFDNNAHYQKAIRFADAELKTILIGYNEFILNRNLETAYQKATSAMNAATCGKDFEAAAAQFQKIKDYKDSAELAKTCLEKAESAKKQAELDKLEEQYQEACRMMEKTETDTGLQYAATMFSRIEHYKDSADLATQCREKARAIQNDTILNAAKEELATVRHIRADKIKELNKTLRSLQTISSWKNAQELIDQCKDEIAQLQAAEAADKEAAQKAAELKKRNKNIAIVTSLIAVALVIVFVVLLFVEIIPGNKYKDAVALMKSGQYDQAIAAFTDLGDYKDSQEQIKACYYGKGIALKDAGMNADAAIAFAKAGDYDNAKEWNKFLWDQAAVRETISAGSCHTIGLKADGTVVAAGSNNSDQCDVTGWTDIVAVSVGSGHTVGLKADGTVVAVGYNYNGECDVTGWTDIVAISAGSSHTIGLKADGTVVATVYTGEKEYYDGECDVSGWTDIVAISAGDYHTVGLKSDGTVVAVGSKNRGQCDVTGWTDIIAISAGSSHTIGLKADGTVVATEHTEYGDYGQCDVSGWTDIVAISAGDDHTVGLKADGTVVATVYTGDQQYYDGECDVSDWADIKVPEK